MATASTDPTDPALPIALDSYDLAAAERLLCVRALETTGNIIAAAKLLGITRHAMKRRIIKHKIDWPRRG
jgi:transcriptional regulator of acetoin/glycerol metabolism